MDPFWNFTNVDQALKQHTDLLTFCLGMLSCVVIITVVFKKMMKVHCCEVS